MKPIFNKMLEESLISPSDTMLEKFLAFKKSLMAFKTSVYSVKKALDELLENDLDMADLVSLKTIWILYLGTFTAKKFHI